MHRLESLERKMNCNSIYSANYCRALNEILEKAYAGKLEYVQVKKISKKSWYLPHFGVINVDKPQKIRLVFTAPVAIDGISLNSQLLKVQI